MNSYCQESLHRWYDDFMLYPMTYIKSRSITCIRVHHCLHSDYDILVSSSHIIFRILSGIPFSTAIPLTLFEMYTNRESVESGTVTVPLTRSLTHITWMYGYYSTIFDKWFCIDPRSVTISIFGLWMLFTLLSKEMSTASLLSNWYIVLIVSTNSSLRIGINKIEL